ncbi:hypothetical protein SK128_006143 [Halocaridina rubra]|uniref:Uncharacterized protein n=1 Tax=Halocaridina rubra TaxID=373956 RepID=A0AAN8WJI0_HALRR
MVCNLEVIHKDKSSDETKVRDLTHNSEHKSVNGVGTAFFHLGREERSEQFLPQCSVFTAELVTIIGAKFLCSSTPASRDDSVMDVSSSYQA